MEVLLKRLALFLIVPIVLAVALYFAMTLAINHKLRDQLHEIKIVFVGDSRVQMAIDNRMVPLSLNISREAESLNYSMLKIRQVLAKSPTVKKVYLGLSYSTLTTCNETFIDGPFSTAIQARYFFVMTPEDQLKMFRENQGNVFSLTSSIATDGFKYLFDSNYEHTYFGNFNNDYHHTTLNVNSADIKLRSQFYEDGKLRGYSQANLRYLDEIIALCKSKNVKLVILGTPLHPYYKSHVPKEFRDGFDAIIIKKQLPFADLSDLISNDSLFASDGQHITRDAVAQTTKTLKANPNW
jgi:hypothetical protein